MTPSIGTFIGLIIGIIIGAIGAIYFGKKSDNINESAAEAIAGRIAHKQMDQLLRLAQEKLSDKKEAIDGTLKNMKQDMKDKLERVETVMKSIGTSNTQIDTRLEAAARSIMDLNDTTSNLKNALASNSARGQWGERMAEDVLRIVGMAENTNYIKQKRLDAAGSKPDFTFLLPQNLKLNMDVKFPFNNYQIYIEAKSDKEKDEAKKKFLRDVRDRVKEVQTRDYINPGDNTVDYVLLFVPNEQIFGFINEMDQGLIDEAMKEKTILCSPLTLYAVLSIIRQSIENFNLEQKSHEMLSLFGTFKQQWEKFKDQMETVGKRLESARSEYEKLSSTRTHVLDKPLNKIEAIRTQNNILPAPIETIESIDSVQLL